MSFDPAENSIIVWLLKNQILTESGKPYDLKGHSFWYDVLCDWSEKIVLLKAAQMGGSTAIALKMLWAMKRFGMNAAYTAPTDKDAYDFVSGKLNPIIRQNQVLSDYIEDKDSVEQKRVGQNTGYFRGTMTDRAALSFTSDLNIHDELDRSKQAVVEQYASRQQHSQWKWEWKLSNPSSMGFGVHRFWLQSDQKHWFIRCSACNERQFLSWPDSIDFERKAFVCKKCHRVLREDDRRKGEWIGVISLTKPIYSGYWFSLLMAPWVKASEIIQLSIDKPADYFYNFVLGLPYAGPGSQLDEVEFFSNLTEEKNMQKDPIVIGVDTGLPYWYVVGNKQGVFYQGKCDSAHDIEMLMHRFPGSIVVGDAQGDITPLRELREKYPGRVFLCWFRQDRKYMRLIEWGKGKEIGKVIADRNRVLQQLMDELRDKRIPIHGSKADWWEVWTHFANMHREIEEDSLGQEKQVWIGTKPDHLCFAFLYWRIGMDKFQNDGAKSVGSDVDIRELLNVQPSFEAGFDNRMPSKFPHIETYDWRN